MAVRRSLSDFVLEKIAPIFRLSIGLKILGLRGIEWVIFEVKAREKRGLRITFDRTFFSPVRPVRVTEGEKAIHVTRQARQPCEKSIRVTKVGPNRVHCAVGRTSDSSSLKAQSPFSRVSGHLGPNEHANALATGPHADLQILPSLTFGTPDEVH